MDIPTTPTPPPAGRPSKVEIDESSYDHVNHAADMDYALNRARTNGAVSISAELFEKLYLSPKNEVSGELRKTFGNPTPIGLIGFLVALSPLSCDLMGWRGASNTGAAGIPAYFFFGGLLMIVGGLLEWILGNSFPSLVFFTFGAFWLTFGGTLSPSFAAFSSFAAAGEPGATGLETPEFNASFGFFTLFMALVSFCYLLCSFRINICFCFIFFTLVLSLSTLTGAYWLLAEDYAGNAAKATRLIVASGAFVFVTCMFGWWNFLAIILESVDFPISLPVGDLSTVVRGRTQRRNAAASSA